MNTNNQSNPLAQFYRQEKLFVPLPSGGNFYSNDVIELNQDGEVGVRPMTAADEVQFKNPDALLNGDAIRRVITSCVPSVRDVDKLFSCDIDTLIVAIRHVSYGDNLSVETNCPNCKKQLDLKLSMTDTLNTVQKLESQYSVSLPDNLIVYVRPFNFKENLITIKTSFEQNNVFKQLDNPDLSEERKLDIIGKGIDKLSKLNLKMISEAIDYIVLPDGETQVSDKNHISDYISNIGRDVGEIIQNKIEEINKIGLNTEFDTECDGCGHKFKVPIDFNPATFFTQSL